MFKRWFDPPQGSYLLVGPRRAGKTTLLKHNHPDYLYITLDDFDYIDLAENDPKAICQRSSKLIIDELQRVPKLAIAIKYAIDEQGATVAMSGSSKIGLLDNSSETLAGRIKIFSLPPLCWGEEEGEATHSIFSDRVDPLQLKKANRMLSTALKFGGFPEIVKQENDDDRQVILNDYKNSYFTRDLSLISNIENVSGLLAILHHFGTSIGSLTQVASFRNESGLSHQTAQKYLNVIYQSDLGFKLLGYQYGPAKRQLKAAKSYFCDNGMLTALNLECSRGQILENFVIGEIEKRRKLGFINCDQLFYYQSIGGSEIDLIIDTKENIKVIEIKASKNPQKKDIRNLKDFIHKNNRPVKGYLFYLGDKYQTIEGVECIPIAALFRGI